MTFGEPITSHVIRATRLRLTGPLGRMAGQDSEDNRKEGASGEKEEMQDPGENAEKELCKIQMKNRYQDYRDHFLPLNQQLTNYDLFSRKQLKKSVNSLISGLKYLTISGYFTRIAIQSIEASFVPCAEVLDWLYSFWMQKQ